MYLLKLYKSPSDANADNGQVIEVGEDQSPLQVLAKSNGFISFKVLTPEPEPKKGKSEPDADLKSSTQS